MDDKTFAVPRLSIGAAERIRKEVGAKGKTAEMVFSVMLKVDEEIHNNLRPLAPERTVVSREYLTELEELIPWLLGEAGDFQERAPKDGAYFWRKELRARWDLIRAKKGGA